MHLARISAPLKARPTLVLVAIVQISIAVLSCAQSPGMVGSWKVDITFATGESRSLRFDAQGDGKGSFLLLNQAAPAGAAGKPLQAKWTRGEGNSVTFSGPIEFPIGNVGRDAGTLVLKGTFETENLITGEVEFSSPGKDTPSKRGTFKAVRGK